MKTLISIAAVIFFAGMTGRAQVEPRVETFLGYTYTRANSATNVPAFSMNGGSGQVGVNFNRWIGFYMDMGAVHNGNVHDLHIDNTLSNYLFGPRLSLHYSRIRPYFQVLFGGVHFGTSVGVANLVEATGATAPPVPTQPIFIPGEGNVVVGPGQPVTGRLVHSQTAFGMTVGGGLDIKINRWVSFRPIQLEYFLTRLQHIQTLTDNNQNNLRYSTGFNFTFGHEHAAPPPAVTTRACPDGTTVPMDQECPKRNINLGLMADQSSVCAGATVKITPAVN